MDKFKSNRIMPLGLTICIDDNKFLILNDDKKSDYCRNWANLHEMGHIYLGHTDSSDKEEVEAHFFAACFLMPDPVIKQFNKLGFVTDENFLKKYFNATNESAKRKIKTMKQYNYPSKYDSKILDLLYDDIDRITDDILDERFAFAFQ
jgi:Zn-dependent peptidase ImmA (M78 family)